MGIISVNKEELFSVAQTINLVRMKTVDAEMGVVAPVLYVTEESMDLLVDSEKMGCAFDLQQEVVLKFQKLGYEYSVRGEITNVNCCSPATFTIKAVSANKYYNLRKYIRFDTNLDLLIYKDEKRIQCIAKNISKGGAMVSASEDIGQSTLNLIELMFESGTCFKSNARILRKAKGSDGSFHYGLQFVDISDDNYKKMHDEILKYERDYFRSLNMLKKHTKKSEQYYNTKISIFSYGHSENYEIREELIKLGAENFEVFSNFKFYVDFFIEEKPKIVLLDTHEFKDEVKEVLESITRSFPEIRIILLVSLKDGVDPCEGYAMPPAVDVLYKPLIYNELQELMTKYL